MAMNADAFRSFVPRGPSWTVALASAMGLVAACSGNADSSPTARRLATADPSSAPLRAVSASASAQSEASPRARSLLLEGRRFAKLERWVDAQRALTEAAKVAPEDVTILTELGWAALHAGDLDAAERVSKDALVAATDPRVRAQILYNLGRVAEARGANADASHFYEQSLALRASKSVEERLKSVGGTAPAAPVPRDIPCNKTFANTAALCACLTNGVSTAECGTDAAAPASESGELEIVKATTDLEGEAVSFLVADDQGGVRPVAELGRDYHPNAFGIDQSAKVLALDEQPLGGRRVAVIRVESTDKDVSSGGAEAITVRTLRSTICSLRDGKHATTCPLTTPIEIDDTHAFPRPPGELTAEEKIYVDAHAKEAHEHHVRLSVKLTSKGEAIVTLDKGDEKDVPAGVLGHHPIF